MMTQKEIDATNAKIIDPETTSIWGFDDISEEDFNLLSEDAQKKLDELSRNKL